MLYLTLGIIWYAIGVSGFVYWWTKDYDLTLDEAMLALFVGLMGPFTWILGATIHGGSGHILLRRRGK